jgi:hypothetical protein
MAQWKKGAKGKQEVEEVEVEDVASGEVEVEPEEEVEAEVEAEVVEEPEPAPKKVIKKAAKAAPVEEVEEVVEEVEVEEPKPAKKGKATAATGEPKPKVERARKWVYGPIGEKSTAKILMIKGATPPKAAADQAGYIKSGMTVAAFYAAGGDRSGLRKMLRGKFIVVRDESGTQFPRAWDPATDKQEPPKRKAKEEEAVEEVEEAPAPKPVKKVKK